MCILQNGLISVQLSHFSVDSYFSVQKYQTHQILPNILALVYWSRRTPRSEILKVFRSLAIAIFETFNFLKIYASSWSHLLLLENCSWLR